MTNASTIIDNVYNLLNERTDAIGATVAEFEKLDGDLKAGIYSASKSAELGRHRDALRSKIVSSSDAAIEEARSIVQNYRDEVEASYDLNPADLNDDLRLLQIGIPLQPRDVYAILERNRSNKTMTAITVRYAREHGIDVSAYRVGGDEMKVADALETVLLYFATHIAEPNAKNMLDRYMMQLKDLR